ncbi:MAG: ethanolamine ammonia-lyase subunit EutC [Acidobacteriaceae bacterium]|nr:ethanolamine ammonia-lyase subunit EutC [Acidobacteriaceae bacterium]
MARSEAARAAADAAVTGGRGLTNIGLTRLRDFTSARVDLPVAGESLATAPLLDLRLAHARARDAVHLPLDTLSLSQNFAEQGWPSRVLQSRANNREDYLRRPDLGRQLNENASAALDLLAAACRYAFVIVDGLSALAVHRHAAPLLDALFQRLSYRPDEAHPLFIVQQGRVAIGDAIGQLVRAELSVVLVGERPGLSSPDSLGVYLTWAPHMGRTDAERNCVSNIHANGLSYEMAAQKLTYLMREAQRRKLTGVALKEASGQLLSSPAAER